AVAVAEDVRRVPALETEETRLEAGREDGLHQRLAGLEILAGRGDAVLLGELEHRRDVDRQVGRAVGVGNAVLEARVGVDLRRRDLRVGILQALLELLERGVDVGGLAVDLGRAAPDGDQAVELVLLLEAGDVLLDLLDELGLALALLHVLAVKLLHPGVLEDRRPGRDRLELGLHRLQVSARQDAGLGGGLVGAVLENVPAAEDEIVEAGDRDEFRDLGAAVVRPLPEPDGAHLGERADRLGQPFANVHHTGDEGGGDRPHAGQEGPELSTRGLNVYALFQDHVGANNTPFLNVASESRAGCPSLPIFLSVLPGSSGRGKGCRSNHSRPPRVPRVAGGSGRRLPVKGAVEKRKEIKWIRQSDRRPGRKPPSRCASSSKPACTSGTRPSGGIRRCARTSSARGTASTSSTFSTRSSSSARRTTSLSIPWGVETASSSWVPRSRPRTSSRKRPSAAACTTSPTAGWAAPSQTSRR